MAMRFRGRRRHVLRYWVIVAALLLGSVYFLKSEFPYSEQNKWKNLVEQSTLKNVRFDAKVSEVSGVRSGVSAYLMTDKENPIVSINFLFKNAGYAGDDAREQGIAVMTAVLLGEGAGSYAGSALKEELENRGIRISFAAGKDDFTGSLLTTKENLQKAAEFLNLMLTKPRFEKKDIARVQKQMVNALLRQQENPNQVLALEFNKELFGRHPYAQNPLGKEADILAADDKKLRRFVHRNLITGNLLVGIAGDIDSAEASALLDKMFAGLPRKGSVNFVRPADIDFNGRVRQINRNTGQNVTLKAVRGVARTDADFYPLFVANHILGGAGLTSRLSQKIREEKGLTYGVYTYLQVDDKAPLIVAGFSSTEDKYAEAEKLFVQEWSAFGQNGVSEEELDKAKDYLLASHNLRFASIENVAAMLTAMQKYNLGLDFLQKRNDYIRALTLEEVNRVARKYFVPQMVSARIGTF